MSEEQKEPIDHPNYGRAVLLGMSDKSQVVGSLVQGDYALIVLNRPFKCNVYATSKNILQMDFYDLQYLGDGHVEFNRQYVLYSYVLNDDLQERYKQHLKTSLREVETSSPTLLLG